MKPLVYLAGGIAGLPGPEAGDWRHAASRRLADLGIEALNPMRAKSRLETQSRISTDFHDYEHFGPFFTSRGIMTRDHTDVKRCDALLVNLYGAKRSDGTVMELAWAFAYRKPTIVVIEGTNPFLRHPMVFEAMSFLVETLDEAITTAAIVLNRGEGHRG